MARAPPIEQDAAARARTIAQFRVPAGTQAFRQGYRECLEQYALHAPNRRSVRRILEQHCTVLEDTCIASMTRENVAAYEGYRQAMKELLHARKIK